MFKLPTHRCPRCAMSGFLAGLILLIGAGMTAVVFPVLFDKCYPQQPGWLALGSRSASRPCSSGR